MQYTGLKDKNNVEIYEGDILSTSNTTDADYGYWESKDYGYTFIYINDELEIRYTDWCIDKSIYSFKFIEVVGNVHENKDLLR